MVGVGDIHPAGTCELVGGHTLPCVEDGEAVTGDTHVHGAAHQLVGHRVMRVVHSAVEIGRDFGAFPFGALPRCFRQRGEHVAFELIEQCASARRIAAKRFGSVDPIDQDGDFCVELVYSGALVSIECVDDVLGDNLDCSFNAGLILGVSPEPATRRCCSAPKTPRRWS